jgi:hypothetical protein
MPVLIDGNNLLHNLPSDQRQRSSVRRQALDAVRHKGMKLTVVFDGPPPPGSPELEHLGQVSVRYSGQFSADDVIVSLLRSNSRAADWVVVTDDQALRDRVRVWGAQVRSLAQWRARRSREPRRPGREAKLSADEVADWEAYFSTGKFDEDPER